MEKKRKFWRGQPKLPNQVWDATLNKGRGGVIADFSEKGYIITSDKKIIEKLESMNYPEVPLDSEAPPFIPEVIQPPMKDVPIKRVQDSIVGDSTPNEKINLPANGKEKVESEKAIGGENEFFFPPNKSKKIARR